MFEILVKKMSIGIVDIYDRLLFTNTVLLYG